MTESPDIIGPYIPSDSEKEKLRRISDDALKFVEDYCSENAIKADGVLVGSVAKNTNLAGADIDLFIRFDKGYSRKEMESLGLELGHKFLRNGMEKYAEHPYVTGSMDGVKLDIVPCYRILPGQKKVSSVDRTPLHTEYVKSHLADKQLHEVLLLKVFAKSIGVYGSEVMTSGFSGYICEILVIEYGSFEDVLKTFSSWRGRFTLGKEQDTEKFSDPVVIIDPVDDDRNAAAAISMENLSRMKVASKIYLKNRDASFFSIDRKPQKARKEDRGTVMRVFSVPKPDLIDDVIYPQAVRFKNSLWSVLEREGFEPIDGEVDLTGSVNVLIECRRDRTPSFILHQGPPVDSDNCFEFIQKWSNEAVLRGPYIKNDRLYVDLKGETRTLEDVIHQNVKSLNIGKNLNQMKGKLRIEIPNVNDSDPLVTKYLSRGLF